VFGLKPNARWPCIGHCSSGDLAFKEWPQVVARVQGRANTTAKYARQRLLRFSCKSVGNSACKLSGRASVVTKPLRCNLRDINRGLSYRKPPWHARGPRKRDLCRSMRDFDITTVSNVSRTPVPEGTQCPRIQNSQPGGLSARSSLGSRCSTAELLPR
jgi:hypothetical protein